MRKKKNQKSMSMTISKIASEVNSMIKKIDRMRVSREQFKESVSLEKNKRLLSFSSIESCAVYLNTSIAEVQRAIKDKGEIQGFRVDYGFHRQRDSK
jgi:TolA-binding protein